MEAVWSSGWVAGGCEKGETPNVNMNNETSKINISIYGARAVVARSRLFARTHGSI